jgi:hypothetical protein
MRKKRTVAVALTALALGGLAACGDDDSDESSETASVTPEQASTEIGEVRARLDEALATYEDGDAEQAQRLAEDAYLEHFELVEGPLEEADPELNEELEETIREEFVGEIESGAPQADVEALRTEIDRGLDEAEEALSAGS